MRLLIDAQALQTTNSRTRGVGRYSRSFIEGIRSVRLDWQIELVENSHLLPVDEDLRRNFSIKSFTPPLPSGRQFTSNRSLNEAYYADWLCSQESDVIVFCNLFEQDAVLPTFKTSRPARTAAIIHDVIPLLFSQQYLTNSVELDCYPHRFRQLCQMDDLLANSASTRDDFLRLGVANSPNTVNIRGATNGDFRLPRDDENPHAELSRLNVQKDFILYVGGCDYRKNMEGTLEAYAQLPVELRKRHQLVITCGLWSPYTEHYASVAERCGVADSVVFTGQVTENELKALYQACRLFFFPSFYEGLGLPVLEAMQSGAPVVCSNCSSLLEFGGKVSHMANPYSPQQLAKAVLKCLAEPRESNLSERLEFAQQFSWERTCESAARHFEHSPITARPPKRRPRLAWVWPITAPESDLANRTLELLSQLGNQYDIEVVVDSEQPIVDSHIASQFLVITDQEVSKRNTIAGYDLFIYQVIDDVDHSYMAPLMQQHPGLAILPDSALQNARQVLELARSIIVQSPSSLDRAQTLVDVPVHQISRSLKPRKALPLVASVIAQSIVEGAANDGVWQDQVRACMTEAQSELPDNLLAQWNSLRNQVLSLQASKTSTPNMQSTLAPNQRKLTA